MMSTMTSITVKPIAGTIGAEIFGVDLTQEIAVDALNNIHAAFLDHLVIFFPQQNNLTPRQLKIFAEYFGTLDDSPFVFPFKVPATTGYPEIYNNIKEAENTGINIGGYWHADVTYRKKPHKASVIYAKEVPEYGGDTMFANQYLAYETLPENLKEKLLGMQAVHSSAMPHGQTAARFASITWDHVPSDKDREYATTGQQIAKVEIVETIHPVVRTHPTSGRRMLYVNRGFTSHFVGMTQQESLPLLEELWAHSSRAEFTCRYRWTKNTVALWDNCATHHYAINDYFGQRRCMQRISIHED
ncbi:MAG: taurine dioxygenase [Parasphingorhabdus sp.]|jgi:taurine dioxygenase